MKGTGKDGGFRVFCGTYRNNHLVTQQAGRERKVLHVGSLQELQAEVEIRLGLVKISITMQ